jgi:nucleotide-binding universal stress UspA family protein
MKVLLPIDGSEAANEALRFVLSIAEDNPVDVVVMTVTDDPVRYSLQPWEPEWTEELNLNVQRILETAKLSLEPTCQSVEVVQRSGSVVSCILNQAKTDKVDLIAIGAKGHSAIRRVLLGSVSDSVATQAGCSVVVVRPTANPQHCLDRIIFAFDDSTAAHEAVTELLQLKLNRETTVDVVSVAQNPNVYVVDGYATSTFQMTTAQLAPVREAAEQIATRVAEHYPDTHSETLVANHVGDAIVAESESKNADLVIVGGAGHSLINEFLLGSTYKYVVRHATCSVWVSRHYMKSNTSSRKTTSAAKTS